MTENAANVLLVEDNCDHVDLTLRALKRLNLNLHVSVARDGEEALHYLLGPESQAGSHPRLILLDLKLPLVDGLEVLQKVKENSRTRDIPVIVLTSSLQESDRERAAELGAKEYISKPVTSGKLSEALRGLPGLGHPGNGG